MTLHQVVEALLISAQKPLTPRELASAIKGAGAEDELEPNEFAKTSEAEVAAALEQLKLNYVEQERAFQLVEKADGTTDHFRTPHQLGPGRPEKSPSATR